MSSRPRGPIVIVLVLAFAAGLWTPSISHGADRTFALNYKRAPITQVIERVAVETQRPILFDEQVRGNVSIVTKRPVTEEEAWSILDASLSVLGFSLLPSTAENWRISRIAEAVGEAPFVEDSRRNASDSFVTTLIPLRAADLQSVMKVLTPLSGTRVTIVPFEPTQSLIASGPEREIARLTTIADELDRVDVWRLRTRVLRYRDIDEVDRIVEARIDAQGISDRLLQVWSDHRTNSLIYRGTEEEVSSLAAFLDRLDQPIEGHGRIQILRVLNRDPEEMADLIRSLATSGGATSEVAEADDFADTLRGADFALAVDKGSRSIIVHADETTQSAIRRVFEILDEQPQLIAIDITISELRTPRNFNLGFGFSLPFSSGNDVNDFNAIVLSSPPGGLFTGPDDRTTVFGRVAHDNGVPFTIDGGDGVEIPILQTGVIRGGEFSARSDILMKPSLIVTAGERHRIFVGNNFPVPVTSQSALEDADSGTIGLNDLAQTTTFERTDVGISLEIEVRAGHEGKIQLDLDVDVSTIAPSLAGRIEQVGPTFVKQTLAATARLDDGETAILAINKQIAEGRARSGVPWLSDLPFFGWLFSTRDEDDQDVRLVIAARAQRVSNPAELVADSIRRRLAFQRRNARDKTLPTSDGPPFGVRVTTRERRDDADAIAGGLAMQGYRTIVHEWTLDGAEYFDVYIIALESMADAAEIATTLSQEGWESDLVVLPTTRS